MGFQAMDVVLLNKSSRMDNYECDPIFVNWSPSRLRDRLG